MVNSLLLSVGVAATLGACATPQERPIPAVLAREAASFDRAAFNDPAGAAGVVRSGNLRGIPCCNSGWAEFDVRVESAGWYELWTHGSSLEAYIDPSPDGAGDASEYFTGGSGIPRDPDKVGNVWLTEGLHRIRFQTDLWWGFSDFRSFELRPSKEGVDGRISVRWPRAGQIFRAGQCGHFELLYGALPKVTTALLEFYDSRTVAAVGTQRITLPASTGVEKREFGVPCDADGFFRVEIGVEEAGNRRVLEPGAVKGFKYEVVDVAHPPQSRGAVGDVDFTIDCLTQLPDFQSDPTRLISGSAGSSRESGTTGWGHYQVLEPAQRLAAPSPSWFAYKIPGLRIGNRYRVEVDYPDDSDRTFGIFIREENQHNYPVAAAVDTGGPYPISNSMKGITLEFWARDPVPRLVFVPFFDGVRASCRRIHVKSVQPNEPQLRAAAKTGRREFTYWYEEGLNFSEFFGATDDKPETVARAADRWAGRAAEMGVTTLMPTVLAYGGQLYPSRFNRKEMFPDRDNLRRILLSAERYGLKLIPELHPRSDELAFGLGDVDTRHLLLVSKDGTDNFYSGDGHTRNFPPYYNVLLPRIQDWLIAMVGELADRYRDSPAFEGISLRYMNWANAALDNLVDLDWGYNDEIVARFARETGEKLPRSDPGDPNRFRQRYLWLTGIGRASWERWRCEQIDALLSRLVVRLRQSRPDLKLYLHAFPSNASRPYTDIDTPGRRLREAGLDPELIAGIPGVYLIDSTASYGRNQEDAVEKGLMDPIRKSDLVRGLFDSREPGMYITSHRYLEANEWVVPASQIGFLAPRRTYASLAANPPGRQMLERLAMPLAYGDALMLGDGGNGYLVSNPEVEAFLAQYTRLPAVPFYENTIRGSSVVVRSFHDAEASWVYAVNCKDEDMLVKIELEAPTKGAQPGGSAAKANSREIAVTIPPFGLYVESFPPEMLVANVAMQPTRP